MTKLQKQRLFKQTALHRIEKLGYVCQVCGAPIRITGNWIYDCYYFDHIKTRSKCSDWEYVNYFLIVCKDLHIYRTDYNNNYLHRNCVRYFLETYPKTGKNFYSGFLEKKNIKFIEL